MVFCSWLKKWHVQILAGIFSFTDEVTVLPDNVGLCCCNSWELTRHFAGELSILFSWIPLWQHCQQWKERWVCGLDTVLLLIWTWSNWLKKNIFKRIKKTNKKIIYVQWLQYNSVKLSRIQCWVPIHGSISPNGSMLTKYPDLPNSNANESLHSLLVKINTGNIWFMKRNSISILHQMLLSSFSGCIYRLLTLFELTIKNTLFGPSQQTKSDYRSKWILLLVINNLSYTEFFHKFIYLWRSATKSTLPAIY